MSSSSLLDQPSENVEGIQEESADPVFLENVLDILQTNDTEAQFGDEMTIEELRPMLPFALRKLVDAGVTEVEGLNGPVDIANFLSRETSPEDDVDMRSPMDDALNVPFDPINDDAFEVKGPGINASEDAVEPNEEVLEDDDEDDDDEE